MKAVKFFTGSTTLKSMLLISFSFLLFSFIISNKTSSEVNTVTPATDVVMENPVVLEPMIGQITMFAGNFAPRGWALCNGQLLAISQNQALFSILGTTYGGDGRTTFGLPDLRGRVPMHAGQGPGLPNVRLGQKGGGAKVSVVKETPGLPSSPGGSINSYAYQSINFIIALQGVFPSRS